MTADTLSENQIASEDKAQCTTLMPLISTYVVFCLDPVATVARLEDEETTTKARLLACQKYAGYVLMVSLRVPTMYADASTANKLPMDELGKHLVSYFADLFSRKEELDALNPHEYIPEEQLKTRRERQTKDMQLDQDFYGDTSSAPMSLSTSCFSYNYNSASEDNDDAVLCQRISPTQPLALLSYDLETVQKLGSPEELAEEIRLIEE
ncbi:hypothetical protein H0H81_010211 [Sphagnurus paluster]|uniref:Uncharacterized protein n=1 Tax=Sphagnurus paluster TaxID=117069 RepID=A0A9P7GJ66_9AGAR|nr:hypothetical protein H0H81_010211 [Sphagnurus paluster]